MKLILSLSSAIALRAAFYAVRGQFKFGEVTPPRFDIDDGTVWLKLNRNIKLLDALNTEFTEAVKDMQAKPAPEGETPEQRMERLNKACAPMLEEKENLAGLTPLTADDLKLKTNGNALGQWAGDMLEAFELFLDASTPAPEAP